MKVSLALIPNESLDEARRLAAELQEAMEAGEMGKTDQLAEKLRRLADDGDSLSISEDSWHKLLARARNIDSGFRSDYLLTGPPLETLAAAGASETPDGPAGLLINRAHKAKGALLELPYDEEGESV